MKSLWIGCLVLFSSASVFAQTSSPTPSPSSSNDYILFFNEGLSRVLATSINLGADIPYTPSDNPSCANLFKQDGAITCLMTSTCARGALPRCGIDFSGPAGLVLSDVADLVNTTTDTRASIRTQDVTGIAAITQDDSSKYAAFLRQ